MDLMSPVGSMRVVIQGDSHLLQVSTALANHRQKRFLLLQGRMQSKSITVVVARNTQASSSMGAEAEQVPRG